MEGCSGSENPPPFSPPSAKDGPETGASGREKALKSGMSNVVNIGRNRREKMAELYLVLQNNVPNLFPRATRTRIIEETMNYIKRLEKVHKDLDAKKKARLAPNESLPLDTVSSSSSVNVTASGTTSFFGICLPSRPGVITEVLQVFEMHKAELLAVTVACHDHRTRVTVTASSVEEEALERIKAELMII